MIEAITKPETYCLSLTEYKRFPTREVQIGEIPTGGNNPIRIQSMTTTDTMNTKATVEQTIRMVKAGCEYVRITAPSLSEAENLENIKKELRLRGYNVPLIADIHFTPNAAEMAARIVEKVRINPGNYADKKKFEFIEYTDSAYDAELERIRKKFIPLVKICKEYGTAMRIGTNHGSLSDRIMSRFGDSPLGMVESALEFVRICEDQNYYNIVLSMKSSNPQVMVQAYRLLILKMKSEKMNYPLHLGVTEAGGGEDGRIKSAAGIGALLEDGIGDTIRVSLTEDPEFEAPAAIHLAERYNTRQNHKPIKPVYRITYNPLEYTRRITEPVLNTGGTNVPVVISDYSGRKLNSPDVLNDIGYFYDPLTDKWNMADAAADFIFMGNNTAEFELPVALKPIYNFNKWLDKKEGYPLLSSSEYLSGEYLSNKMNLVSVNIDSFEVLKEKIKNDTTVVLLLETDNEHGMAEQRRVFIELQDLKIKTPVIIKRNYSELNADKFRLFSSTDIGALLIDGFGDGVWLNYSGEIKDNPSTDVYVRKFVRSEALEKIINRLVFGILQAARVRISKTEYIACPSCGRTLFDLQETTEMIRKRTEHLKGIKIAIMGCIVNGPGEMADADYGYVGSGVGKISLYRGKDVVRRNISSADAVNLLIELIKEDDKWVEPV